MHVEWIMCGCLFVTIIKLADNKTLLYFRRRKNKCKKNSIYFLYCFAYILMVCFAYFAIISWPVLTGGNNISISTMFAIEVRHWRPTWILEMKKKRSCTSLKVWAGQNRQPYHHSALSCVSIRLHYFNDLNRYIQSHCRDLSALWGQKATSLFK